MKKQFRVWHNNEMYYPYDKKGNIIIRNGGYVVLEENFGMPFNNDYRGLEGAVLMQYIGMEDKNYKEIYEGDIIGFEEFDYDERKPYTEMYSIAFGTMPDTRYGYFLKGITLSNYKVFGYEFSKGEVMGNIYENPELIKV